MKTFSQDHGLAALPVPDLPATSAAVVEMAAPLVPAASLDFLLADLDDFCRPGGDGERLQALLMERAQALPGNQSWLRPLWDEMYLSWRAALPVNMNYFFRLDPASFGGEAALPRLVMALTGVFARLADRELEPERHKNGFMSMDQAASCLYTRIPCQGSDVPLHVDPSVTSHIAVLCRGHCFALTVRGADGQSVGEAALGKAFAAIRREAALLPLAAPLCARSAAGREEAADLRAAILKGGRQNRLSLALLEKALFTVCLDPPWANDDQAARALLGGDAANRFFDKSLQIIASENNELGVNLEHSGCDGAIWVYLLGRAAALMNDPAPPAEKDAQDAKLYRLLDWDIAPALRGRLAAAREHFARSLEEVDICCRNLVDYGRESIKSMDTAPDAFLQAAFQVAQYRVFGRLRSSYEAVAVRGFAQGRTECARGSSGEALALALALQKGSPKAKLLEYYRQTERIHKARLQRCQRGLGVERHFYGLHAMWQLHGKAAGIDREPAIFRNPAWAILKHDALSTSGLAAPFITYFGFGPVVEDGFGVGYSPEPDRTGLVITAFRPSGLSAAAFAEAVGRAAGDIAALLSYSSQ